MTWDRVERLLGEDVLSFLSTQTVGIIGLGSGGSFAAVSLAMSGVGRFILVDDDSLEPTNVVRHAADRRYLDQLKVDAVADLIRQRNPAAEIKVVAGRIEDHTDLFDEMDLVVSGVDSEGPKYLINQMCLEHGRTAIYAGVYERGEGGDVCVIVPGEGPCYACWAEHLREGLADPGAEPELDYGMIGPEGTLAAEPGLWLHVVRIAATQADLALNELVQNFDVHREMPGNTVVLANTWLEIYEGQTTLPYSAEWLTIPRNPDCLVCGPKHAQKDSAQVSLDDLISLGQVSYEQDENESSQ
ncbi:MAG TPA: ThiF family adenylyltransferase [Aggregatilinea sp.]|jgi:molybdopterin/thiamine biosynthesis adenylyltransferase|uniref:HesA/MoeB/ThiF family protein n=1 Tax=Aggregatilinea sp. TaxID=2806333 RepID=UPI002BD1BF47|nr:ThiF family adenylyltransferase [Aggregatilinea sp.]HML22810.1 ThiF family adenylyltransferase [Aggregatilinea sp.]